MKCGPLLALRIINNGFGLHLTKPLKRSLVYSLEAETTPVQKGAGSRCQQFIANVLFVILIFGLHMIKLFLKKDTVLSVKKQGKQTILNDLTSRCAKESQDW